MSRRPVVALAFVSFILMGCFCGGASPVQQPGGQQATDKKSVIPVTLRERFGPEPVFVFRKPKSLPPRHFKPILSSSVRNITVDLVSGKIEKLRLVSGDIPAPEDVRRLVIVVRVTNLSQLQREYVPWHIAGSKAATDEHGTKYGSWVGDGDSSPMGGIGKKSDADFEKPLIDIVAFAEPRADAQEIDFSLPGENIEMVQPFRFKIGRDFFAKEEDARVEKIEWDRQFSEFEVKRLEREQAIAKAEADQKQIEDELAAKNRPADNGAPIQELDDKDFSDSRTGEYQTAVRHPSGRTVYVRGYYRSNGSYVAAHTRSVPGSGSTKSAPRGRK